MASNSLGPVSADHPVWGSTMFRALEERGWLGRADLALLASHYGAAVDALSTGHEIVAGRFTGQLASGLMVALGDRVESSRGLMGWIRDASEAPSQPAAPATFVRCFIEEYLESCARLEPLSHVMGFIFGHECFVARMQPVLLDAARALTARAPLQGADIAGAAMSAVEQAFAALRPRLDPQEVRQGFDLALSSCQELLDDLADALRHARLAGRFEEIQSRVMTDRKEHVPYAMTPALGGKPLFVDEDPQNGVCCIYEVVPCTRGEAKLLYMTCEPRVMRIPSGKKSRIRKHPQEAFFQVYRGRGAMRVGDDVVPINAGDSVFAPRWTTYHAENTGTEDLLILEITDAPLVRDVYLGKLEPT